MPFPSYYDNRWSMLQRWTNLYERSLHEPPAVMHHNNVQYVFLPQFWCFSPYRSFFHSPVYSSIFPHLAISLLKFEKIYRKTANAVGAGKCVPTAHARTLHQPARPSCAVCGFFAHFPVSVLETGYSDNDQYSIASKMASAAVEGRPAPTALA